MKSLARVSIAILLFGNCQKTHEPLIETPGFSFQEITGLPAVLTQSSGIAMASGACFWSFNDGSGKAEIYGFEVSGTLKRSLKISNAANVDWEDIVQDEAGNIYIGDFADERPLETLCGQNQIVPLARRSRDTRSRAAC